MILESYIQREIRNKLLWLIGLLILILTSHRFVDYLADAASGNDDVSVEADDRSYEADVRRSLLRLSFLRYRDLYRNFNQLPWVLFSGLRSIAPHRI